MTLYHFRFLTQERVEKGKKIKTPNTKQPSDMRPISDLMASLMELTDGTVNRIRKTAEDPPRISVYDVLQLVTACSAANCAVVFTRLGHNFPVYSAAEAKKRPL